MLCKGVNDREELDRTIADLGGLIPAMASVSIVPVGLSRHPGGPVSPGAVYPGGCGCADPADRALPGEVLDRSRHPLCPSLR